MSTNTQTFHVTGMTSDHSVNEVTDRLKALDGVQDVDVALQAGGVSHVRVSAERQVQDAEVADVLREAGDYALA